MILSTLLLLTPFAALPQERKARQLDRRPTQGQQAECENCRAKAKQGSQKGRKKAVKSAKGKNRGQDIRKKAVKSAKGKNRGQDIRKKLGAAVQSGKITREEAGEKMRAFKLEQGGEGQPSAGARVPEDMMGFRRRLGAAVQSGKITREEAGERMKGFQRQRRPNAVQGQDLEAVGMKIRAAIREGKMTREEGRKKMEAIRKKAEPKNKSRARARD